jgi:hypothetical protein
MDRVDQRDANQELGDEGAPTIAPDRGYLTDGTTLFHVERTLLDDPHREPLIEIEDCMTLELIVCSARSVGELGLRPVQPQTPSCV